MKAFWIILAAAGGVIAAVFVFRGDYDNAFLAAAGGAVCWFLHYRQQLRAKLKQNQGDEESDEEVRS